MAWNNVEGFTESHYNYVCFLSSEEAKLPIVRINLRYARVLFQKPCSKLHGILKVSTCSFYIQRDSSIIG